MLNISEIKKFINESRSFIAYYFNVNNKKGLEFNDIYKFDNYDINNCFNKNDKNVDLENYLGNLYENSLNINDRKDLGLFYTKSNTVIHRMLGDVELLNKKILEPSCGAGAFVISIIKNIISLLKNKTSKDIVEYICNHIYVNDIDEMATAITEINIIGALMPLIIDAANKYDGFHIEKFNISNYDFTKKHVFDNYFDLVIGNPPFVTMYGKRSRNMTEEKRKYFNTFDFVQNKNGNNKFNISMFFIENALKILNKNGMLVFILDISFFETAFLDLRKYLIQNYDIIKIIRDLKEFDNVSSGQIIIEIRNSKTANNIIKNESYISNKVVEIRQKEYDNESNNYKYYLPFNSVEDSINKKIRKYNRIDYYFPNKALRTCCALTGKTDEFIVDNDKHIDCEVFPYIEGSKGLKDKFGHLYNQRFIKYDYNLQLKLSEDFKVELEALGVKNKKRVTLGDKDAYKSPKIFIRQSAFEIISTYTEKEYAANNSIYVLTLKSTDEKDKHNLKYLCGILNSDLITFYCRINKIIRIEKGKTPQIKISDLKDIRICMDNCALKEEIVSITNELLVDNSQNELFNKLNSLVFEIYGIDKDEVKYIYKYLNEKN